MSSSGRFGGRGHDEEEEGANWLDSYSDLVTDLMAIFVVLFSFAMMNQAIAAYEQANENEEAVQVEAVETNMALQELEESLTAYIDEVDLSDYLSISQQDGNKILLRMSASVLFEPARATITSDAELILDSISGVLDEYGEKIHLITVEGHADIRPINNDQFPSNWELSTTRAVNVVRYMLEASHLLPEQLSAVGYAEFHPIADNETAEGMAQNRRVDFIIELKQE